MKHSSRRLLPPDRQYAQVVGTRASVIPPIVVVIVVIIQWLRPLEVAFTLRR